MSFPGAFVSALRNLIDQVAKILGQRQMMRAILLKPLGARVDFGLQDCHASSCPPVFFADAREYFRSPPPREASARGRIETMSGSRIACR